MGLGLWTSPKNYILGERTHKSMSWDHGVLRRGCWRPWAASRVLSLMFTWPCSSYQWFGGENELVPNHLVLCRFKLTPQILLCGLNRCSCPACYCGMCPTTSDLSDSVSSRVAGDRLQHVVEDVGTQRGALKSADPPANVGYWGQLRETTNARP